MQTSIKSFLISSALALGTTGTLLNTPAFAADEVLVTADVATSTLAVQGYDVIAYRGGTPTLGSVDYAAMHEGATYRFASQANLDAFTADPARFVPAYGGFCAYGVAKGKKFEVDPTAFSLIDDVLYLNYNRRIQKKWSKKTDKYIDQADGNWSELRSTAFDG
ncbi:MAG: YHS domain-containing (seleno)protein [Litorimonas sp.]